MSNHSENKTKQEEQSLNEDEFEDMEVDNDSPETGGELIDTTDPSYTQTGGSGRKRVKIKKRIRVKKKTSTRRKYKKLVERIIWFVFIIGFVISLYYLLNGLGISDQKYKSTPKVKGMIDPQIINQSHHFYLT